MLYFIVRAFATLSLILAAVSPTARAAVLPGETPSVLTLAPLPEKSSGDVSPVITFVIPVPAVTVRPAIPKEDERFLSAIAAVESTGDARKVGRRGERGLYQFRAPVWRQYTTRSFWTAHDPKISTQIAYRHCEWIRQQLINAGRRATSFEVALAWNAGVTSVLTGKIAASTYDYARRVNNLYASL